METQEHRTRKENQNFDYHHESKALPSIKCNPLHHSLSYPIGACPNQPWSKTVSFLMQKKQCLYVLQNAFLEQKKKKKDKYTRRERKKKKIKIFKLWLKHRPSNFNFFNLLFWTFFCCWFQSIWQKKWRRKKSINTRQYTFNFIKKH